MAIALLFLLAPPARAQDLRAAAQRALAGDENAIAELRQAGPPGLSAVSDAAGLGEGPAILRRGAVSAQRLAALDRICAQRDCASSRLYWFTDLEAAKAEAARRGLPILSLRLLGRLDEELSCANSRYFRLAVYSNREVSGRLRDHWVLHWSSERPVPHVRVDFGDGRALEGTLTGNSAHYLLDARGRPLDVLPGLYSPQAFLAALREAEPLARGAGRLSDERLARLLRDRHRRALARIELGLARDLAALGYGDPGAEARAQLALPAASAARPTALDATAATVTKAAAETPLYDALLRRNPALDDRLPVALLAGLPSWRAACDPGCRELAAAKATWVAGDFDAAVERFERALGEDTVRNEIRLHSRVHRWFTAADGVFEWGALNRRVYDELFLSPRADPWLGLAPREVFSVLSPAPPASAH